MLTNVADTSLTAYREHRDSGAMGKQASTVFAWIALHPHCSRKEIARGTGIELSAVCGRVAELIDAEKIHKHGVKRCAVTGKAVAALRVCPVQPSLFQEAP